MHRESPRISLNTDTGFLKIIAILAMLSDHLGKCLFPHLIILQILGRIAFPLFAYCLVVGFLYTADLKKYIGRLGLFFLISQPFYTLAFHPSVNAFMENIWLPNIFLDLILGLIVLWGVGERKWWISIAAVAACALINTEYGVGGALLMLSFYGFRHKRQVSFAVASLLLLLPFFVGIREPIFGYEMALQGFGVLSLPFIYVRTAFRPKIQKHFFYVFYPAHLAVLFVLRLIFKV